jgi:hypothetical protein
MVETIRSFSPVAPAITPLPPNDRRCTRAAEYHTRRLSPAAGDTASGPRLRPPFECIALVLQGGGALGAYQAGVYEALTEADLHPDWIAGISIGAINGALIAGTAPEARLDKLRAFWERVTAKPSCDWSKRLFDSRSDAVRQWQNHGGLGGGRIEGLAGAVRSSPQFSPLFWSEAYRLEGVAHQRRHRPVAEHSSASQADRACNTCPQVLGGRLPG